MSRRESKYHLITANFEEYDFNKLFNEESENESRIIWKIGIEGGRYAQNYNVGDICYIYYSKLPDGSTRILLRAEVVESDTDQNIDKDKGDYLYNKEEEIKGMWLSNIRAIALEEPEKFSKDTLSKEYNKSNIQGQQYLGNCPSEDKLIKSLEEYPTRKKLKAVREYFDNFTKCFFDGKDKRRHITFTSGRGLDFYERHHFVLDNYLKKIGEEATWLENDHNNLVHLCPICHRKIHHGIVEDVREMIDEIYSANAVWFDKNLSKYAKKDGYSEVREWIYYIYNQEREKNKYELL